MEFRGRNLGYKYLNGVQLTDHSLRLLSVLRHRVREEKVTLWLQERAGEIEPWIGATAS